MDYDIFREELATKYPAYGHALWEPSPGGRYTAVEIGDVGFIREGYFHRLFNILLPEDHPSHQDGVPQHHEPLILRTRSPTYTGTLQPNHLRSNGVSDRSDDRRLGALGPDEAERHSFSCSRKRGAILSLPVPAQRKDTAARGDFAKCITKHINEWFAFAQERGFGISREDIILVTGCHLARTWATIAFQEREQQMSFGVQVLGVSHVSWQFTPEGAQGVAHNLGPSGQNLPESQCIFIRGFRVTLISKIFPRLRGAAGLALLPGEDDSDPDTQLKSTPDETRDPLYTLLEYIATQAPDCDMALVHDDDLQYVYNAPEIMMSYLRKFAPEISQFCTTNSHSDEDASISGASPAKAVVKVATLSNNVSGGLKFSLQVETNDSLTLDLSEHDISGALATWKNINFSELQKNLGTQCIEVIENQKESVVGRKALADKTKDFKKIPEEEKVDAFKGLLKSYQTEIDNLTKRSKSAESVFFSLYKLLADAPDPYPLLEAVVDPTVKIAQTRDLEDELLRVKAENAKLQSRIHELADIDAAKKKAKGRAQQLEEKKRVSQKENEPNATYDERMRNYEAWCFEQSQRLDQEGIVNLAQRLLVSIQHSSVMIPVRKKVHTLISITKSILDESNQTERHYLGSIITAVCVEMALLTLIGQPTKDVLFVIFFTVLFGFSFSIWSKLKHVQRQLDALRRSIKPTGRASVDFESEGPDQSLVVIDKPLYTAHELPLISESDNSSLERPTPLGSYHRMGVTIEGMDNIMGVSDFVTDPFNVPVIIKNPSPAPTAPSEPDHGAITPMSSDNRSRLVSRALHSIRSTPPRVIASPPTQPRRAAVALIIRVVPPPNVPLPSKPTAPPSLSQFFELDWVRHPSARPEILFVCRQKSEDTDINENTREARVAFPGGCSEQGDEGSLYTAMRQTWEEIGLDLAESDYTCVGQLDDREITTSLGKRLLMILSPFVFLQLTPTETPTEPISETTLHWVPLNALYRERSGPNIISHPIWSTVTVDTASRLTPKHSPVLRPLMRLLLGSMQFPALVLANTVQTTAGPLDNKVLHRSLKVEAGAFNPALHPASALYPSVNYTEPQALKLWGLSLGMTLDLLSYMSPTPGKPLTPWDSDKLIGVDAIEDDGDEKGNKKDVRGRINAPSSLTSVFPRFSYPDVNFWIWVFGKRYRQVIRNWEATLRVSGANDTRINWTGAALTTFYAAVRNALVVVLVLRAIGVLCGATFAIWWMLRR